ncbi:MAG: hypothetical protein ACE5GR_05010 [Nitrosopumilus sp.]
MMQTTGLELPNDWKSKILIDTKNPVKSNKMLFKNNSQYSNLKWEDIAGLGWNIIKEDE